MPSDEVTRDTIAAIATPAGRGGIGVVRLSGPRAPAIARSILGRVPEPRQATHAIFRDGRGEALDEGIALYFPEPHSYTGEPVLELQGHGGPVVMHALLAACVDAGARLAEPGEFTRRAFLEGKLDLAQAEAVADLIDAASREAARSALRSLSGEFSTALAALQSQLTELRALTEAMLDFPEEEVDALHREDAAERLGAVRAALEDVIAKSRQGSLLRSGIHVVLAGRPNVGKSSLLNRLAGEERAIVTPIPGTTRDALREPVQIAGVPLVLVDTAGLRVTSDVVERLGVERTQRELEQADVVLAVYEAGGDTTPLANLPPGAACIDVYNKIDLTPGFATPAAAVAVSAKTGEGLERLRQVILRAAGWLDTGESVFLARERHLRALDTARRHLDAAAGESHRWEFFAEELRLAHAALGSITGEFSTDDLLGEIFARFCIGK
ncbi:MAG TPA: tRNA uridine-5-carboxymethylaminomethyl(34) synthesis GTPase MnmE [Burkholderiales bacterium]|nr:tRNA uridine-5-carboxymethylaminomethyl(34) synthesis GTPase MnmE [Burkholderiales bacterium]